VKVKIKFL